MRKHELIVNDQSIIKKNDYVFGGDGWQPWQLSSWNDLRQRTIDVIYQGEEVKITKNKIPIPFFELSENYVGLIIDPGLKAEIGLDLLILPHHNLQSPPIVPLTYSVDVWSLELLLIFKREKFSLKPGTPLAEAMLVPRAETIIKNENLQRDELIKNRKSTRKINLPGKELDNYYELVKKFAKTNSKITPIIFKREYSK